VSVFADSSAVVKLYANEADSGVVRALSAMYISELARVEVAAALWRKHRMGELSFADCEVLVDRFRGDFSYEDRPLALVRVSTATVDRGELLVARHRLRAYDAMQLACAQMVADIDPECATFCAFDHELRQAASREGFALLPRS